MDASVLKSILILPGTATVLIPALLLRFAGPWSLGPGRLVLAVPGALLLGGGLLMMYHTVSLFARAGQGTLAPWDPPKHLVIVGVEEPQLEERHGEEYRRYRENVPRWIPRRRPWEGNSQLSP